MKSKNLEEFINNLFSKNINSNDFELMIELINKKNNHEKSAFLDLLNKKYDSNIKNKIEFLKAQELDKKIKNSAKIILLNFIFESKEKKLNFILNINEVFNSNIKSSIFFETVKICIEIGKNKNIDINFKELRDYIFNELSNKVNSINDINKIMYILDILKENENISNEFLQKIIENNLFSIDDFFFNNQNLKITLIYKLYETGKIKRNNQDYLEKIEIILDDIKRKLDGDIKLETLHIFLKNDKSEIIQRLKLLNIILEEYNPLEEYNKLKKTYSEIDEKIIRLKFIQKNIILYYKETYKNFIKKLEETLRLSQEKRIFSIYGNLGIIIEEIESRNLLQKANKINSIKIFCCLMLFMKILYPKMKKPISGKHIIY